MIKFNDHTNEFLSAFDRAKIRGLEAIGLTAERHAKRDKNMPVDTGRARNSITYALAGEEAHIKAYSGDKGEAGGTYNGVAEGEKGSAVYIGSNVEYFPFIELGSRSINARHVLKNAASSHASEYKQIMKDSMENA
jgi:hypothetical protein